ncbi:uncharacterized protein KZ484_010923 [Pholidichthys leucotaenia]
MEPRREDFPEQHVCENEFSPDQHLWNQEGNSGLEQEEPEPPQVKEEQEEPEPPCIKEEQEELFISQEREQLETKLEADTFMVTFISEEKQQSKAEPNSEQLLSHNSAGTEIQDEEGSQYADSGSTKEEGDPKPKKRRLKTGSHHEEAPQLHDYKEEELLSIQQLCNQEKNSSLDQKEQNAAQVKEEEEELCSNLGEENVALAKVLEEMMGIYFKEADEKSEVYITRLEKRIDSMHSILSRHTEDIKRIGSETSSLQERVSRGEKSNTLFEDLTNH